MIRLLSNGRLIIPKGDSGSFSIKTLYSSSTDDIAVFSIFDPLYQKTILTKIVPIKTPKLTFSFAPSDTLGIAPRKYLWDIAVYISPMYDEDGALVDAEETHSYFSAYKLPTCKIADATYVPQEEHCECKNNS